MSLSSRPSPSSRFARRSLPFDALVTAFAFALAASSASAAHAADRPAKSVASSLPPPPPPPPAPAVTGTTTTTSAAVPRESPRAAFEAPSDKGYLVAPMLGYSTNDLNLGLGVRVHKLVTDRFSIGGTFVYQLGRSDSGGVTTPVPGVPTTTTSYSTSFSLFYVGPEAGYDFPIAPVVIRPYVGAGIASLSTSVTAGGVSSGSSASKFVIWPGAMVTYDMPGSAYFVGGDLRMVTVPGGPALGMFVLGGMRL